MNWIWRAAVGCALAVLPVSLAAQQEGLRTRLEARGLPADLVTGVMDVAANVQARGLPADAVANKAIEGWAKHVPGPRILATLRQQATRLGEARDALVGTGFAHPDGEVIVAAGEAIGQGLGRVELGTLVRTGSGSEGLAAGMSVAAALVSQGFRVSEATGIVAEALRAGRPVSQVLDLPSVARALRAQGLGAAEIGRRMLGGTTGAGVGAGGGGAGGVRPGGVPAGMPGGQQNPTGGGNRPPGRP